MTYFVVAAFILSAYLVYYAFTNKKKLRENVILWLVGGVESAAVGVSLMFCGCVGGWFGYDSTVN